MSHYTRIFLDGYSYYITMVTHARNPILLKNIELLRESFKNSKEQYSYTIDAIVILPDHLHMIITPQYASDYPKIIRAIKYHFSTHYPPQDYAHIQQSQSRTKRGLKPIWQKRFYEHTIRNEKDREEKITYIQNNPVKHRYVTHISDWEFMGIRT